MIHHCQNELMDIAKVTVTPIPDFGNNEKWLQYILTHCPHFDYVLSGNVRVQDIFKQTDKIVIPLKIRGAARSSTIRNQLALGNYSELEKSLPPAVIEHLKSINAFSRLKGIMQNELCTPKLAVDVVFFDKEGNLILIERKNEPLGKALPGGFVDYGEAPEIAASREAKEETSANVHIKELLGVRGKPDRDPRGHVVTLAYHGEYIDGELQAKDDAKSIIRIKPEDLDQIHFAFSDHKEIIEACLKKMLQAIEK